MVIELDGETTMSALGQADMCSAKVMSAVPPKATLNAFIRMSAMGRDIARLLSP